MDAFGVLVIFSGILVGAWEARSFRFSSFLFLASALLFAAADTLGSVPDAVSWLFVLKILCVAFGKVGPRILSSLFWASGAFSSLAFSDLSERSTSGLILCLCGALIEPFYYAAIRTF